MKIITTGLVVDKTTGQPAFTDRSPAGSSVVAMTSDRVDAATMTTPHTYGPGRELGGVFLIGFGFFAISVSWASYNAYVPLILRDLGLSTTAVGAVMALDNVFGLTLQPLAGMVSDHARSPIGRRLPFILVGAPICALALAAMPAAAGGATAGPLIALIVVYTCLMAVWRTPTVALMPDLVASAHRSRANGVINLMGTLGSLLLYAVGGLLMARLSYRGPFWLSAVLMVGAVVILALVVREPGAFRSSGGLRFVRLGGMVDNPRSLRTWWQRARAIIAPPLGLGAAQRRSLWFMLGAIFLYTLGGNALDTFVTTYLHEVLEVPTDRVTGALVPYVAASILFAIPAGYVGQWIGRRRSLQIGLVGGAVVFVIMYFVRDVGTLTLLMPVFGVLFITVIVNALPLVVEMGGAEHTGTLAAYYYLAGSSGAIVSPVVFGFIRDLTGNFSLMFWYAAAGVPRRGVGVDPGAPR